MLYNLLKFYLFFPSYEISNIFFPYKYFANNGHEFYKIFKTFGEPADESLASFKLELDLA